MEIGNIMYFKLEKLLINNVSLTRLAWNTRNWVQVKGIAHKEQLQNISIRKFTLNSIYLHNKYIYKWVTLCR